MKKRKRKQYIINPPVQFKLTLLILLSVIIPTILTFLMLFFLIQNILLEAQMNNQMVYHALLFMSHKVYCILFIGFVLVTILLILWSTIFIHRIVGPLYRLEKELDKMIEGKPITKIRFRKNDKLTNLADKLNTLIEILQKKQK